MQIENMMENDVKRVESLMKELKKENPDLKWKNFIMGFSMKRILF